MKMKKAMIAATAGVALFGTGFLLGNVQNKKEILPIEGVDVPYNLSK